MSWMLQELHRLIPGCERYVPDEFQLTADHLTKAFIAAGYRVDYHPIVDGDWDLMKPTADDLEILETVCPAETSNAEDVWIYSAACWREPREPFRTNASELREFVEAYDYGMLFDSDTILLFVESKIVSLFHHEGYWARVRIQVQS
ncbi:hypothetical protein [Rubinisphaera brasiliensis]|uniref:Uncharacterized protein n=1 Tax=Rubinisphaera brasiliensis (strain ATCC 49424 / DSM 5305 / JCM 21570 / IAM 15109 / NBRC 103401 / IFAM 1448) TaxID=756272 RepID=F0SK75_RUBBR|nr:hypothetical protein [Rubinisphaera brasiliensis]ADY59802.1 hypothetical protein Plabr_2200 [Rubinisphaera brasiliensis DSM 5305]